MLEAGLQTARAVIAATDQDPVNIEIAIDAPQDRAEVPVVVRLFDETLGPQLETTFEINTSFTIAKGSGPGHRDRGPGSHSLIARL